jgi:putative effector of murein hydrolase
MTMNNVIEFPTLDVTNLILSFSWILATLFAYILGLKVFNILGKKLLFHPILFGAVVVAISCTISATNITDYHQYVSPLNLLLGPVTVALAVPLFLQLRVVFQAGFKGFLIIVAGGCIAPLSVLGLLHLFDFSSDIKLSSLTKSITTPLAMDTSIIIGGIPELSAAIVVITGIIGVLTSTYIFNVLKCSDQTVQGLVLGTTAHAIGTAHALQLGKKTGAFSTMALCVNGLLTAIVLPSLFFLFD